MTSFRDAAERIDPVDPPTRLRGSATDSDLEWYDAKGGTDPEPIREQMREHTHEPAGLLNQTEKGLHQVHRWSSPSQPSLREIVDRHDHPETTTHKLLVYNTWLMTGIGEKPIVETRTEAIADRIVEDGYDIVGLCEVFDEDEQNVIKRHIESTYDSWQVRAGQDNDIKSDGLYTAVMGSNRKIVRTEREEYDVQGGLFEDRHASKGVLYTEIDLSPVVNLSTETDPRMHVDFYLTHPHADYEDDYNGFYRVPQLNQLAEFVDRTQDPRNVTVVGGDFNVPYRHPEYGWLLDRMDRGEELSDFGLADLLADNLVHETTEYEQFDLGLEDAWLTRGGKAGSTSSIDDFDVVCTFDDENSPDDPAYNYCDDYAEHPEGHAGAATDDVPGYRLDYLFVERPKDSHTFDLDVARMRRRPFWQPGTDETRFSTKEKRQVNGFDIEFEIPHFLSDHLGIEVELIASPRE